MSLRYSSLFARNVTRAFVSGAEVESSVFLYAGPKAERSGEPIVINGLYVPATNGVATFNASALLTDHVVLAEIPFGARVTRAQFIPAADLSSGASTVMDLGFRLNTPPGVVNINGNNPTIEDVFTNSFSSIVANAAGVAEGATVEATVQVLGQLAVATRPANRVADYYQVVASPRNNAFNQSQLRFNIEYVWP